MQAALELLAEIARSDAPADVAFAAFHRRVRRLSGAERHAVQERVRAWLRRRAALDWWIERAGERPQPRTRALAALVLLEGWTPERLARVFGGAPGHPLRLRAPERALVAALSGSAIEHPEQPRSVRLECPEWLLAELEPVFGAGLEREIAALREPAPIDLRVNTLASTREGCAAIARGRGDRSDADPVLAAGLARARGAGDRGARGVSPGPGRGAGRRRPDRGAAARGAERRAGARSVRRRRGQDARARGRDAGARPARRVRRARRTQPARGRAPPPRRRAQHRRAHARERARSLAHAPARDASIACWSTHPAAASGAGGATRTHAGA